MSNCFADTAALSCDWSSGSGQLTPKIPGSVQTTTVNSAEKCRVQCMSQTAYICAAVNYRQSDGQCELLAENDQTASVVGAVDNRWRHYIRPICAGMIICLLVIFYRSLLKLL